MNIKARLCKLHDEEVSRWRAAWERFDEMLWSKMTSTEKKAYYEYFERGASEQLWEAVVGTLRTWQNTSCAEMGLVRPDTEEDQRQVKTFFEAFAEARPGNLDEVDLTRWPSGVPFPAGEHDSQTLRKEEEAYLRLVRREKGQGDIEQYAGAFAALHVAICQTARHYSRREPGAYLN